MNELGLAVYFRSYYFFPFNFPSSLLAEMVRFVPNHYVGFLASHVQVILLIDMVAISKFASNLHTIGLACVIYHH